MTPDGAWDAATPFFGALAPVVVIVLGLRLLLQWIREVAR